MIALWFLALAAWIVLCVCIWKFFEKINRWILLVAVLAPFLLYVAIPKVYIVDNAHGHQTKYMFTDTFTTDDGTQHSVSFFKKYLYNHSSHRLRINYIHYVSASSGKSYFPEITDKVEVGEFREINGIDNWFERGSSSIFSKNREVTKTELFYDD